MVRRQLARGYYHTLVVMRVYLVPMATRWCRCRNDNACNELVDDGSHHGGGAMLILIMRVHVPVRTRVLMRAPVRGARASVVRTIEVRGLRIQEVMIMMSNLRRRRCCMRV